MIPCRMDIHTCRKTAIYTGKYPPTPGMDSYVAYCINTGFPSGSSAESGSAWNQCHSCCHMQDVSGHFHIQYIPYPAGLLNMDRICDIILPFPNQYHGSRNVNLLPLISTMPCICSRSPYLLPDASRICADMTDSVAETVDFRISERFRIVIRISCPYRVFNIQFPVRQTDCKPVLLHIADCFFNFPDSQ